MLRNILRRAAALLLMLALLCALPAAPVGAEERAQFGGAYANSDLTADTPDAWYELDPDSGVLLERDPVTLQARALTEDAIAQMALLDGRLYLLREADNALLQYDPADGGFRVLRRFDSAPLRYAVTGQTVYYLLSGEIRRSAFDGSGDEPVVRAPGLYRFWLADGGVLEYMCSPDEICTLRLSDGSRSLRKNETSSLLADLRGKSGINFLKEKFPDGKYWNHCGGPNDPDGWTETPCTHHGYHGSGCNVRPDGCDCNCFCYGENCYGIQCFGFGYKLADEYYGSTPEDWNNRIWWHPTEGLKAGDMFRYKNNRHTIWITAVDGDMVTFADCNYDGTCVIRWDQKASISTLKATANFRDCAPVRLDVSGDLAAPVVQTAQGSYPDDALVSVTWNAVEHASDYGVVVTRDGESAPEQRQSGCELLLDAPQAGEYVVEVRAYNANGASMPGRCSFTVVHIERQTTLALWLSPRPEGEALEELLLGEELYLNYRLFDLTTGQDYDQYAREAFSVTLTAAAPGGASVLEQSCEGASRGAFPLTAAQAGDYRFCASAAGGAQLQTELTLRCREATCQDVGHRWSLGVPGEGALRFTCEVCGGERALLLPAEACEGAEDCPGAAYSDMPPAGDWAHEGLDFLLANAVMNGVGEGRLAPSLQMNRAMLVTLLWRLEGRPATPYASGFEDVKADDYFAQAVAWAARNGIVNGTSQTRFSPLAPITREQLAAVLCRYAARRGAETGAVGDLSDYPDADEVSGYAVAAFGWATEACLIRGVAAEDAVTLSPKAPATRAQIAAILLRLTHYLAAETD